MGFITTLTKCLFSRKKIIACFVVIPSKLTLVSSNYISSYLTPNSGLPRTILPCLNDTGHTLPQRLRRHLNRGASILITPIVLIKSSLSISSCGISSSSFCNLVGTMTERSSKVLSFASNAYIVQCVKTFITIIYSIY